MTLLFKEIIFGPIKSRRFGNSLGINLLPLENKVCNFNCIYCECGWTDLNKNQINYFSVDQVINAMKDKFLDIKTNNLDINSITFAGNGEPTMHPQFDIIIDNAITLRDELLPGVKITVLSNSSLIGKKKVFNALLKVDKRVMKLDAGSNKLFNEINIPLTKKDINWYIKHLMLFKGKLIIQTIFLKGIYNNKNIDNTSEKEITDWINALTIINPEEVMIYTIDRETPAKDLEKITSNKLHEICHKVRSCGINANVYL